MHRFALVAIVILLSGCASLKNTNMYGSENIPIEEQAVISSRGFESVAHLQLTAINGSIIDRQKTVSFIVPTGTYEVAIRATKDERLDQGWRGLTYSIKVAELIVPLVAQGGHTYIPIARVQGDHISVVFEDKGQNFPSECLPVYVTINNSSNIGLRPYRTDKQCELK